MQVSFYRGFRPKYSRGFQNTLHVMLFGIWVSVADAPATAAVAGDSAVSIEHQIGKAGFYLYTVIWAYACSSESEKGAGTG